MFNLAIMKYFFIWFTNGTLVIFLAIYGSFYLFVVVY